MVACWGRVLAHCSMLLLLAQATTVVQACTAAAGGPATHELAMLCAGAGDSASEREVLVDPGECVSGAGGAVCEGGGCRHLAIDPAPIRPERAAIPAAATAFAVIPGRSLEVEARGRPGQRGSDHPPSDALRSPSRSRSVPLRL